MSDGLAPTLKSRLDAKDDRVAGGARAAAAAAGVQSHRRKQNGLFAAQIRDCCQLLQLLDIPVLQLARGEAEALCGQLSARGHVDGVVTTDTDTLLFGARTVLKNLEASSSNLAAAVVRMDAIQQHLQLDRHKLILLALLLGSDYTSGCRGVGPKKALKLLRLLDACCGHFRAEPAGQKVSRGEHGTMAVWRAVCAADTPEEAVQLVLSCLRKDAPSPQAASAAAATIAPIPPSFALMSLSQLAFEMGQRGLKPLASAAAMIAKLELLSSRAAPAAAATAAVGDDIIYISSDDSSSDSEEEDASASAAAAATAVAAVTAALASKKKGAKQKKKGGSGKSSHQLSLHSFLRTYLGKVHARYHPVAARAEMELAIQSYLQPALQPSIEQLEKLIHTRM